MDISKITSNIKSWLYADQLLKPEEHVMYRPPSYGGLGVINVKMKAMAGLIKSFLETAGNEKFLESLYHTILFKVNVLDDISLPSLTLPPFYNKDFFATIRRVHLETPLNVLYMSEKEWYTFLLEDKVIKEVRENGLEEYKLCRVERLNPQTDWEKSWRLARLPGLGHDNISFLFRLLHQTLPTQERVARTKPGSSSLCKMEDCHSESEENLVHALFFCEANDGVGLEMLNCLQDVQPGLGAEAALQLQLQVGEEDELPLVWVLGTILRLLWNMRQSSTKVRNYVIRSQLEADINLLRETRFRDSVQGIKDLKASIN